MSKTTIYALMDKDACEPLYASSSMRDCYKYYIENILRNYIEYSDDENILKECRMSCLKDSYQHLNFSKLDNLMIDDLRPMAVIKIPIDHS
jgi:hypothetical protein